MLYRFLHRDKVGRPVGTIFVILGLILIALPIVLRQYVVVRSGLNSDRVDFFLGLFAGVGIALGVVGISAIVPSTKSARSDSAQGQ